MPRPEKPAPVRVVSTAQAGRAARPSARREVVLRVVRMAAGMVQGCLSRAGIARLLEFRYLRLVTCRVPCGLRCSNALTWGRGMKSLWKLAAIVSAAALVSCGG